MRGDVDDPVVVLEQRVQDARRRAGGGVAETDEVAGPFHTNERTSYPWRVSMPVTASASSAAPGSGA